MAQELRSSELSDKYNQPAYILTYGDVVEITYFLYEQGWISWNDHDRIHELLWDWKVLLDQREPGWMPSDLSRLVKEVRNEK